jgi:hypothetical protein
MSLEQAQQTLEAASREHERLTEQRKQVKQSIEAIGQAYHWVDLARGVRRNGQLIASDIRTHIATIRTVAQHEQLSRNCLDRLDKAERVVPKMQSTIEFVSSYVALQVKQLDLPQPVSFAMHAKLIPSYYLDRVAQTHTVSDGEPLRELARRLRPPVRAGWGRKASESRDPKSSPPTGQGTLGDFPALKFQCGRAKRVSVAAPPPASKA